MRRSTERLIAALLFCAIFGGCAASTPLTPQNVHALLNKAAQDGDLDRFNSYYYPYQDAHGEELRRWPFFPWVFRHMTLFAHFDEAKEFGADSIQSIFIVDSALYYGRPLITTSPVFKLTYTLTEQDGKLRILRTSNPGEYISRYF